MIKAFASKLWPDLIIHPHPVSLVNPSLSANDLIRTDHDMPAEAPGSVERGIDGKPDLYDIHIFDSKSSRNADGQPPSTARSCSVGISFASTCCASSKLLVFDRVVEGTESAAVDTVVSEAL